MMIILFYLCSLLKFHVLFFFTTTESLFSWYFLSQFFEAVKELHKLQFSVLINITTICLIFVGHQVRKTHANVYKLSKLNYTHKKIPKNFQFVITLSTMSDQR